MGVSIFTDKNRYPSPADVEQALGAQLPLWFKVIEYLRHAYPAEEDFKFLYGKQYGWGLRFRVKGQLLTTLYPGSQYFSAQVNLTPAAVEQALQLALTPNARTAIERAHPYPEGRWVFMRLESHEDFATLCQLLHLRVQAKKLI